MQGLKEHFFNLRVMQRRERSVSYLHRADRILACIMGAVLFFGFLYVLPIIYLAVLFQCLFGFTFYLVFYLVYSLPHLFRDGTDEQLTEDYGESYYRGMDDDWVPARRADQAIITWWEHTVHNNFWYEFWRGNYWQEEIEEDWDWPNRKGLEIPRKNYVWNWKTLELDWYNTYLNYQRGEPMILYAPSIAYDEDIREEVAWDTESYMEVYSKKVNPMGVEYLDEWDTLKSFSVYAWMQRGEFFYGRRRTRPFVKSAIDWELEDGVEQRKELVEKKMDVFEAEPFYDLVLVEGDLTADTTPFRTRIDNNEVEFSFFKEMDQIFEEDEEWEYGEY